MSPRSWVIRIQDMVKAIEASERITKPIAFAEFKSDETRILAIMSCINILGEASNIVPDEIKLKYSEIPWSTLKGIRNKIIHEYFKVDEEILWNTCKNHLPVLKKQLEKILDREQF